MRFLSVAFLLLATPAFAQTARAPQPTTRQVQESYLIESGQLRAELGQQMQAYDRLEAQLAAANKKLDSIKTPKPHEKVAPK